MTSAPAHTRLGKAGRKLVSTVLWGVGLLSVIVLASRYLSGDQPTKPAEKKPVAYSTTKVTPANVAAMADEQAHVGQVAAAAESEKRNSPPPGTPAGTSSPVSVGSGSAGGEPLRLPPGTPAGKAAVVLTGAGAAEDTLTNIRNQARASKIDAYEDATAGEALDNGTAGNTTPAVTRSANVPPNSPITAAARQIESLEKSLANLSSPPAAAGMPGNIADTLKAVQALSPSQKGNQTLTQVSQDWLTQQQQHGSQDEKPLTPQAKASDYILFEGTLIPIVLLQDVASDLPGSINAMVTQDVYDSIAHRYLLIPRGTRIRGLYNSEVIVGQSRLLMAFSRMIFPNGASMRLGAMPGSDVDGATGIGAEVNNHFWTIFGSSLIIGAVSLAAAPGSGQSNVTINIPSGSGGLSAAAGQALADTVKRMLDRTQNIKPTLSLTKGEPLNVTISRDMILPPAITGGRRVM